MNVSAPERAGARGEAHRGFRDLDGRSRGDRLLRSVGLRPMAHRPPLIWRFWIYSVSAYVIPVVVLLAFPSTDPGSIDELVWLITLVPAFLLSLHFGLSGAFVALLGGTTLLVAVQLVLALYHTPHDPRIIVPIYIAYGALAITVGWLSEQLHEHYEEALRIQAAQKTDAMGNLAAGIAHDFNNILTVVVANAELIASELPPNSQVGQRELDELRLATSRGTGMVRKLLSLSRRGMLALKPVDLPRVVRELSGMLRRLVPETIRIEVESASGLPPVMGDEGAIEQIIVNLVTNARDAMPGGGHLTIDLRMGRLDGDHRKAFGWGDPGQYLCMSVTDNGVGMHQEDLEQIFEPFVTSKPPGEGTGLGMAMVYGLVKQHRGFVDVDSEPGQGTTVRIYFPVTRDPAVAGVVRTPESLKRGSETILLVEDDELILRAARTILERSGYALHVAMDGEEALTLFRLHQEEVSLLLSDVVLPKLTGPDVYEAICREFPAPKVLFMSGYDSQTLHTNAGLDLSLPLLQKPWTAQELTSAVRAALDGTDGRATREPPIHTDATPT